LLIQLIKVDAELVHKNEPGDNMASFQFRDKLYFRTGRNMVVTTEVENIKITPEIPVKEIISMSKEDTLAALRQLRNKLRRDPGYFSELS